MFRNYIKIAWRNLKHNKVFSFINIGGMAVAICVALLLGIAAYHEWSYDQFHVNRSSLYELYMEEGLPNGKIAVGANHPAPLMAALKHECPGVGQVTRYQSSKRGISYNGKTISGIIGFADTSFLRMFTFPLLRGNINALRNRDQVLISEETAKNIFGTADPLNKIIEVKIGQLMKSYTVGGVMANVPKNSSIYFEVLVNFSSLLEWYGNESSWSYSSYYTFVQLQEHAAVPGVLKQMQVLPVKYMSEKLESMKKNGVQPGKDGLLLRYGLIPLKDIHFDNRGGWAGISKFYPWMMVIIAIMIVIIAAGNFINLSIGRSFTRAGEIGMRKAMGAQKGQLIAQFWGEAFILCSISLLAGVVLASFLLPSFNELFRYHFSMSSVFGDIRILAGIIAGFLLVTLLAGGYPAWMISRFKMLEVLKGKLNLGRKNIFRNALIVVQFSIAVLLISCTVILWQQLTYLRSKPLGYNEHEVISIPVTPNLRPEVHALTRLRAALAGDPHIIAISGSNTNFGDGLDGGRNAATYGFDYKDRNVKTNWTMVDYDYLQTLGLELVAGRDFSRAFATDSSAVIINELMAKQLAEKDPIGVEMDVIRKMHVVGVVKDFNFRSLKEESGPMTMELVPGMKPMYIFVRVVPADLPLAMDRVQKAWRTIDPEGVFEASFLDENVDRMYRSEARLAKIIVSGAVIAIVISCMGLFAIAVLVITQRNKEIGIRKVLGASVSGIVALIARDFLKLVIMAILIATPVAWYMMHAWLQDFAYHVNVQWWVFVLAGVAAVVIAFVTISFQSVKAALMNPVKSLKTE